VARAVPPFGAIQPDGPHASRDALIGRDAGDAGDGAGQAELVERIRHRTRIESKESFCVRVHGWLG
jgi:hypothetical protein